MNQFAWWYQINEKEPESWSSELFKDWKKNNNDPLKDLDWKSLKANGAWLYWSFCEKNEQKETIEVRESEKHKENPNYPIIQRFLQMEGINVSNEDKENIYKSFENLKEINLQQLRWNIEWGNFSEPKLKLILTLYLSKIEELNINQTEEKNDSEEIKLPEEFRNSEHLNDSKNEVIQLLAQNYIKIPDWENWQANFDKDIQTCFEITTNKIIIWKEFPRNEAFEIAIEDIKSWDLETKIQALEYIHSLVNTSEWIRWAKSKKLFEKVRSDNLAKKQAYLDFKITKLQKQIEQEWDKQKKKSIELQIEELKKEKQTDDFKWEVFSWWEKDKMNEENNNPLDNL